MKTFAKLALLGVVLTSLTACTGSVQKSNGCSYDYLLHPAISISKIIGGCEK